MLNTTARNLEHYELLQAQAKAANMMFGLPQNAADSKHNVVVMAQNRTKRRVQLRLIPCQKKAICALSGMQIYPPLPITLQ